MSLYNMLFGQNVNAEVLLKMLNLSPAQIPRFRDVFWDGEFIVVHTRTGGGNRGEYACENEALRGMPGFVCDRDSEFDCTYADFYFKPPAELEEAFKLLQPDLTPAQKWDAVMKALDEKRQESKEP
jgi:hypothetical protein